MKENDLRLIDSWIEKAESRIPSQVLPKLPPIERLGIPAEWRGFEYAIWRIGEEIRQIVTQYKTFSFSEAQQQRIVNIATNPCAQCGRQSFIMLLHYKKYRKWAPALITQIDDEDVCGHVIHTVYKMQADGYYEAILPYCQHETAWIRNIAKKYCQKYPL